MTHPPMKRLLLSFWLALIGTAGFAQTGFDTVVRTDRTLIPGQIAEIGETSIVYYRPNDAARKPQTIARSQVWKIIYATGEEEVINAPASGSTPKTGDAPTPVASQPETKPGADQSTKKTGGLFSLSGPKRASAKPAVEPEETLTKMRLRVRAGVVLSDFARGSLHKAAPLRGLLGFQAGASMELTHSRHFGSRLELSYVQKGAHEKVDGLPGGDSTSFTTTARLGYAHFALMPLILKAGLPKINPFLTLGGYGSYLLHASYKPGSALATGRFSDSLNKLDYGWVVGLGAYVMNRPIEFRYEGGLSNVNKDKAAVPARNQAVSFHLSF